MAGQSVSYCPVLVKAVHGDGERGGRKEAEKERNTSSDFSSRESCEADITVPISQIGNPSQRHEAACQVISNKKENLATSPVLPDLKAIASF